MLKLNLGSGGIRAEGWTNVDFYHPGADIKADLTRPLPFETDSVDEVEMQHVIEHIPYRKHIGLFEEIHRILKPDGKFHLSCPDFESCARAFLDNHGGRRWSWWVQTLYGSQTDPGQFHVAPVTLPRIRGQLSSVGFRLETAEVNDSWDINIIGYKDEPMSYFM